MTYSKTLEKDVSSDIGLLLDISVLSPFLNIGLIWENFNHVGNIPVGNILLQMYVRGDSV